MLGETDYAVIVLDWLLPGKDGMTLFSYGPHP